MLLQSHAGVYSRIAEAIWNRTGGRDWSGLVGIGRDWSGLVGIGDCPGHPGRCQLRSPSKLPGAKNGQSCQDLRKREQDVRELRPLMTAHGPFHTLEARWYHTHTQRLIDIGTQ